MHNEEYIASGILELYAAGGLSQTEMEEVEHRAATSPEVRRALNEACAAMEAYASLYATSPKPEVKDNIMQRIEAGAAPENQTLPGTEAPIHPLYTERTKEPSAYKWMFAASIVLFILSGLVSLYFYNKWQQAEDRLATVVASEQLLAQNFRNTSLQLQKQEETLSILRNPEFRPVVLQGVEAYPNASLMVYWNPREQKVYVDRVALPSPPAGKQYQLWALENGNPVNAGMIDFTNGEPSLQQMKNIGAAQAFAVTLEPEGGSTTPTLEELTVMGKIEA
ncbi:anti-sigma factor [Pontibacter cellulosilyticus]|uniref:Anti-sigma factor n=1 Tax=Pontibacter cellulosilyticus TaxID=1720253 RepID=A0A923SK31_9BACT|nr:anti-sigma factor [Pontibacter cellulosilyticus]MBC5994448.1 anti-sigma factor [Pontibacter cellulosilyticus]